MGVPNQEGKTKQNRISRLDSIRFTFFSMVDSSITCKQGSSLSVVSLLHPSSLTPPANAPQGQTDAPSPN